MLSDESPSWIVACRSSHVFFAGHRDVFGSFVCVLMYVTHVCIFFLHMPHVYKLFANDILRLRTTTTSYTSTEYQHWILDDLILVFDWLFVRETHKTQTENLPICFGIWAYHRYFRICVLVFFSLDDKVGANVLKCCKHARIYRLWGGVVVLLKLCDMLTRC